jgi:uncharacterized membrane protein
VSERERERVAQGVSLRERNGGRRRMAIRRIIWQMSSTMHTCVFPTVTPPLPLVFPIFLFAILLADACVRMHIHTGFPSSAGFHTRSDSGFILAVIRGEEWLPSACKHVLLYHAFNTIASIREEPPVKMPKWAHLPLLLNAEGGKLSKRHSHGSVSSLRAALYEPQAVVNFVASLGFTFASDNQILSLPALAAQFDLSRVHAGGAQVCLSVCLCVCVCVCLRGCVRVFVVLCVMNISIIVNHSY